MIDIFSLYAKEEVDSSGLFLFMGARGYLAVTVFRNLTLKYCFYLYCKAICIVYGYLMPIGSGALSLEFHRSYGVHIVK